MAHPALSDAPRSDGTPFDVAVLRGELWVLSVMVKQTVGWLTCEIVHSRGPQWRMQRLHSAAQPLVVDERSVLLSRWWSSPAAPWVWQPCSLNSFGTARRAAGVSESASSCAAATQTSLRWTSGARGPRSAEAGRHARCSLGSRLIRSPGGRASRSEDDRCHGAL